MIGWDASKIAAVSGASLLGQEARSDRGSPTRAVIDSRALKPGELFIGLGGQSADGGVFAAQALRAGAWGVLVRPEHAQRLDASEGVVLAHEDPLAALQNLARAWRGELKAKVIAITGSTGKTSTKDILAALLAGHLRSFASPQNFNTEIGLPLALLAAPATSEVLVLELAMRGSGQIAQLSQIARPDIGVITNIGPVHLELLGSLPAIAAAKAELIAALPAGSTVVIPGGEPLLEGHLRADLKTVTFGADADTKLVEQSADGEVVIYHVGELTRLRPSFSQPHNLHNLLAAVAVARALGVAPAGRLQVSFSGLRGERLNLAKGITLINDCYNANPVSMRAALDDLAQSADGRRVAVLGDMLELGSQELAYHRQVGEYAAAQGVELLVTVGPLATAMREGFAGEAHSASDAPAAARLLIGLLRAGDTVLVKGSRGVGMERIATILEASLTDEPSSPVGTDEHVAEAS